MGELQYGYEDWLAHHGVPGMKWGKWNEETRRRYTGFGDPLRAKKRLEQVKQDIQNKKEENVEKAQLKIEQAEKAVRDSEIGKRVSSENHRSQHRKKLEDDYQKQGMSKKDAEIAAYKRDQTEKILAVAGVLAVSALAVYAYRTHRTNIDTIIPEGTTVQHITLNQNKGVKDAFYASFTKSDKNKYVGMYGGYQLQTKGPKDIHIMTAQATRNLNVAGANVGKKTVQELIKTDPQYASSLKDAAFRKNMTSTDLPKHGYRNLMRTLNGKATLNDKGYDTVNSILNEPSNNGKMAAQKFYQKLRENGYDGVLDTHDVRVSGYRAKKPVILFNGSDSLGNVRMSTINSKQARKKSVKYIALLGGIPLGKFAAKSYAQTKMQQQATGKVQSYVYERRLINDYKKQHPKTTLSDKQILEVQLRR